MQKTVQVGLIQTTADALPADNIRRTHSLIRKAADKGAQIICTQELYTSLYFCQNHDESNFDLAEKIPGELTQKTGELARELGVVIISSVFENRTAGIYHNSATVHDADGSYLGIYRKMHIPEDPGFHEKYYFTPGDTGFKAFDTQFGRIGVLICWDQWFPEAARLTALEGASILFYPTAIGVLPEEDDATRQEFTEAWEIMHRSHAIANGVFVAAINRVGTEKDIRFWGNSFMTAPSGKVLARSGDEEEVLVVTCDLNAVEKHRRTWPYLRDRRIDAYKNLLKRFK
ncbi:MAG: carbon-nitrogen hydrolase [Balneolales bacterium]|nr:carbon-nitrogen hydrolase [Balneolales bacterium]